MADIVVKVHGRKKRNDDSVAGYSVFEKIRRERQEQNRKLIEQYKKEINKLVYVNNK